MAKLTVVEAINLALKQAMASDDRVLVLGEDVGKNGGVFRATQGLLDLFGENRVVDTPLSESAIIGASIGLAVYGLRPIAELQFEGFAFGAMEQLVAHASRIEIDRGAGINVHWWSAFLTVVESMRPNIIRKATKLISSTPRV